MTTKEIIPEARKDIAKVDGYTEIKNFADAFIKSGYFADVKSLAQSIVKIQAGRELNLPPVYSMQKLYFVKGRLGMAAETMATLFRRNSAYDYRIKEHTDQKCVIEFYPKDKPQDTYYTSTFTVDDAKRAKLLFADSAWEKFPRAMVWSRAISQGVRIVDPSSIAGGYTLEELHTIPQVTTDDDLIDSTIKPANGQEAPPVVQSPVSGQPEAKAKAFDSPAKPQLATVKQASFISGRLKELDLSSDIFKKEVLMKLYGVDKIVGILTEKQAQELADRIDLLVSEKITGIKAIEELQKLGC